MRVAVMMLCVGLTLSACGGKIKRLDSAERDHFYALRVYLSDAQQKDYLKLKTREERDAWLKSRGLWERFYRYDADTRDRMVAGEVAEGWAEEQLLMSWGAPLQRRRMTSRPAERSELLVYRFEVDKNGVVRVYVPNSKTAYKMVDRYQVEVYVDDGRVTEMRRKAQWE